MVIRSFFPLLEAVEPDDEPDGVEEEPELHPVSIASAANPHKSVDSFMSMPMITHRLVLQIHDKEPTTGWWLSSQALARHEVKPSMERLASSVSCGTGDHGHFCSCLNSLSCL
jgi:hypothetical protein